MVDDTKSTKIPKILLDDLEIHKSHILFYIFIKENPFANQKMIADHFNYTPRNSKRISKLLKDKNYIDHEQIDDFHWIWKTNI